jgi:hypothetical protein
VPALPTDGSIANTVRALYFQYSHIGDLFISDYEIDIFLDIIRSKLQMMPTKHLGPARDFFFI